MPAYSYRCSKCDAVTGKVFTVEKRRKSIKCEKCGGVARRDLIAEHGTTAHHAGNWPLLSDSAGVHPDQIPEAVAQSRKMGVPIEFKPDGRAIFTSARHRKSYCEQVSGMYDKSGGYSDPQRR